MSIQKLVKTLRERLTQFGGTPVFITAEEIESIEILARRLEIQGEQLDQLHKIARALEAGTRDMKDKAVNYCRHNDCGWCYAPAGTITNDREGACNNPQECPENTRG